MGTRIGTNMHSFFFGRILGIKAGVRRSRYDHDGGLLGYCLKNRTCEKGFFFFFAFTRATPSAYGGSQATGRIRAVATGSRQSQSNAGSEPHLQATSQLTATLDP